MFWFTEVSIEFLFEIFTMFYLFLFCSISFLCAVITPFLLFAHWCEPYNFGRVPSFSNHNLQGDEPPGSLARQWARCYLGLLVFSASYTILARAWDFGRRSKNLKVSAIKLKIFRTVRANWKFPFKVFIFSEQLEPTEPTEIFHQVSFLLSYLPHPIIY